MPASDGDGDAPCAACPCPVAGVDCLRWPVFCGTLAHGDEVQRRHVVERSRMGDTVATYPPPLAQAGNLARSLWDWAVDGFKVASPGLQERRRATCAACPRWVPADRRCILCGCYTEAKITLKAESCPEGRW